MRQWQTMTLAAVSLIVAQPASAQETLTVYAPDYFASEWGPGPAIETAFEEKCDCDLKWVTGDVLPRILLEGERTKADVVIGLNTDVTARARASGLFAPHEQDVSGLTMPVEWDDDTFLPFDWSYVAFVYDKNRVANPPSSFEDLLNAPDTLRVVVQDPRSSVSGLALLFWVKAVYGADAADAWARLKPRIVTFTKGWSEAYGMFTDGEADMVLSYSTSPAYHIAAEGDESKAAAIFSEGHYLFVELAAKIANTDQPELADAFMQFVLSPEFQTIIPEGNWSYPAKLDEAALPQVFQDLPRPDKVYFFDEERASRERDPALAEWLSVFSR
jgi:thiamine transport system substrate-binding protein